MKLNLASMTLNQFLIDCSGEVDTPRIGDVVSATLVTVILLYVYTQINKRGFVKI